MKKIILIILIILLLAATFFVWYKLEERRGYTLCFDDGIYFAYTGLSRKDLYLIPEEKKYIWEIDESRYFIPVKKIANFGISNYYNIKTLIIPSKVEFIEDGAFDYANFENLIFAEDNKITAINTRMFKYCNNIVTVELSSNVTELCDEAFSRCSALVSVSFGKNSKLESIGDKAFYDCVNLKTVSFPENSKLESIGDRAFMFCESLESIELPSSVKSIGERSFSGCLKLSDISFGEDSRLESIGDGAFFDCEGLVSIEIPSKVTSIADNSFLGCYKLVEIINKSSLFIQKDSFGFGALGVHSEKSKIEKIGDYLFYNYDEDDYILIGYAGNDSILELPTLDNEKAYTIWRYAFYNLKNIKSVKIPESIKAIYSGAFYGCTDLKVVVFENTKGWMVSELNILGNYKSLSSSDVGNGEKIAAYLTDKYSTCNWYVNNYLWSEN